MTSSQRDYLPLVLAAIGLAILPSLMHAVGLGTTSATEVVVFAMACMALNILVGLLKGATIGLGYPQWSTAVIYLMMLLVLLFRPRGLFGERIQRFE